MNIKIEDITDSQILLKIFEESAILSCNDAAFIAEQYKFMTRAQLVSRLEPLFKEQFLDISEPVRKEEFAEIEEQYKVIIDHIYGNTINVYYACFDEVNRERIELELNKYEIAFIAITPYNYAQLRYGEQLDLKWDSDILFKRILSEAVQLKATDLHFSVEHEELKPVYKVQYRRNGYLYDMDLFTLTKELNQSIVASLIAKKTSSDSLDLNTPSGVTAVANDPLGTGDLELRISANRVEGGWHCVIRIQAKDTFNFTIDQLGFPEKVQNTLVKMTKRRSGIVFITGAIRTGKNTTAFAMANEMKKQPIKIASYEYPIEVLMPFPQIDYKGDVDVLLESVRLAKKQDLNVAFINELPNKEVAFAVRDLVNSSVYVITTMHVDRIWHLPYKLKDYYGEDYRDVISQINAVFNQKMFGKPCPYCKTQCLTSSLDKDVQPIFEKYNINNYFKNEGCELCRHTGIDDGTNQPYVEFLEFTPEVKSKLLSCEHPFEMEAVIRDAVNAQNNNLEYAMVSAISAGELSVSAINSLL